MGWEGKVIISFVITKDGRISFLTVEKSSGYRVLDENAIDTIKKVSKYFPAPPLDIKIRVPITYKLYNLTPE
jgi:protein TonB